MNDATAAIAILVTIFGSVTIIVWLGIRYSAAKKGLVLGGSKQGLQAVHQTMKQIQRDIEEIKSTQADLVIELHDRRLEKIVGEQNYELSRMDIDVNT